MSLRRILVVVAAAAMPALLAACPNRNDDDKPASTVAPTPTPTPTPTPVATVVPEEDAGSDASDASDADADAKPTGVSNLTKCCNAIKQNAKSAPPEQQLLYGAAIQICNSGVIPPQFRNLPQCK